MQKVYKRTPASKTGHNVNPEDSLLVFGNALPPGNRYDGYSYKEMFVVDPTNEFYSAFKRQLATVIEDKGGDISKVTNGNLGWALSLAKMEVEKTKAKEPKHLGAKVVDRDIIWEAIISGAEQTGGMVWFRAGDPAGRDWDAFSDDVQVVFEGYRSEES